LRWEEGFPDVPLRKVGLWLLPVLAAAATLAASGTGREEVVLTIGHSRFVPNELSFREGDTVTFVLVNTDPIDHEFILGDEATQNRHETGTEPHHDSIPTEVSLPAGETVRTTVTLDRAGPLIIGCHLPGHYAYGMRAEVTVTG
jgi:uncharacterized cupredoxin-like copper-binding protein